jgi:hypothetical protein
MDAAAALSLFQLQVAPCSNVRGTGSFLAAADDSTCLAPGLFQAATAMKSATKVAGAPPALDMTTVETTPAELPEKPFLICAHVVCWPQVLSQVKSASFYREVARQYSCAACRLPLSQGGGGRGTLSRHMCTAALAASGLRRQRLQRGLLWTPEHLKLCSQTRKSHTGRGAAVQTTWRLWLGT